MIKAIKQLFCKHIFEYNVINTTRNDYHAELTCRKCDKVIYKFE